MMLPLLGPRSLVSLLWGALRRGANGYGLALMIACGASAPPPLESAPSAKEEAPVTMLPPDAKSLADVSRSGHGAPSAARPTGAGSSTRSSGDGSRAASVRGITGSLTAFEVEHAMNARQSELLACVQQRPRSLGHVAGDIAFHFDVDGQGKVESVSVVESDLGYPALETCLANVVATAPLKPPAGAQRAEARWRMSVDPLSRPAEPIDSAELESTIERHVAASYESCGIGKGRRFLIHGYIGRKGTLSPLSARAVSRKTVPDDQQTSEQMTCLADALTQWKGWPKGRGISKVSFELRWVPAPPPTRKSKKARRRR